MWTQFPVEEWSGKTRHAQTQSQCSTGNTKLRDCVCDQQRAARGNSFIKKVSKYRNRCGVLCDTLGTLYSVVYVAPCVLWHPVLFFMAPCCVYVCQCNPVATANVKPYIPIINTSYAIICQWVGVGWLYVIQIEYLPTDSVAGSSQ